MRVLVTGSTGDVGRALVDRLLDGGAEVHALTRNPAAAARFRAGVEVAVGDANDPELLDAALDGVDSVHLVADLVAPHVVARIARSQARRVVVLSGFAQGPVEEAVRQSRLRWTLLRPVEFMANALAWSPDIRAHGIVREPFPELRSARIHESDVADVAAAILFEGGYDGRSLRLTGAAALTTREAVRVLAEVVGRAVRVVTTSPAELRAGGMPADEVDALVAWAANPPPDVSTVLPTVEQVTGRRPRSFAEWVVEHAQCFR
ncbi:NAD(P)H-binding protein [Pseudonocardia sp. TRM90224]|uniref:NAD(P)H-binding protein n=1 Tax=Pseudonocardia sp. TRM90224 TaxID=2812678 RepID=UPI001E60AC43|nr:NAD(P)H-binding protein [Pseudonocardia sp. TRM90224]